MAEILEGDRVGVAINGFDEATLSEGLDRLLALCGDEETRHRCRESAGRHFSLEHGVRLYERIYDGLSSL